MDKFDDTIQDLLNRMKRNHDKGIGIRLSAKELNALSIAWLGEIWDEQDPRNEQTNLEE